MMRKILYSGMIRRVLIIFFVTVIVLPTPFVAAKGRSRTFRGVSAKAAILSDATQATRLYGKNIHSRVLPASTVKVMTAILVLERLSLDDVVTVSQRATLPPPSKINLRPGEQFKVRDLLWAVLLSSANDASVALAEAVAGSESRFVVMMNQRAKELGAQHTKFANASGLPTPKVSQYTTAYDMYLFFIQALKYPFFRQVIESRYKTIHSLGGRMVYLKSHNQVLFKRDWKRKVYGKTGYTRGARACFVGTVKKEGRTLIVAVFGCSHRWEDIRYIVSRYGGVSL